MVVEGIAVAQQHRLAAAVDGGRRTRAEARDHGVAGLAGRIGVRGVVDVDEAVAGEGGIEGEAEQALLAVGAGAVAQVEEDTAAGDVGPVLEDVDQAALGDDVDAVAVARRLRVDHRRGEGEVGIGPHEAHVAGFGRAVGEVQTRECWLARQSKRRLVAAPVATIAPATGTEQQREGECHPSVESHAMPSGRRKRLRISRPCRTSSRLRPWSAARCRPARRPRSRCGFPRPGYCDLHAPAAPCRSPRRR